MIKNRILQSTPKLVANGSELVAHCLFRKTVLSENSSFSMCSLLSKEHNHFHPHLIFRCKVTLLVLITTP